MPDEHSIANAARLVLAPQQLEARDLDLALGDLDVLARAGQRVRALAADLDRAVGRRALRDAARRQRRARSGIVPGAISPSGSPVVDVQPSRATVS